MCLNESIKTIYACSKITIRIGNLNHSPIVDKFLTYFEQYKCKKSVALKKHILWFKISVFASTSLTSSECSVMAKVEFSFHNNFVTDEGVVMKLCTLLHTTSVHVD